MTKANPGRMDPLIEGYLSYLDKIGRKTPRTIVDVRCTLRRVIAGLRSEVALWHLELEDYLHWLEAERRNGCTESTLAKYLSHVRGLLGIGAQSRWRSDCRGSDRDRQEQFLREQFPRGKRLVAHRPLTLRA